jgi:transposase
MLDLLLPDPTQVECEDIVVLEDHKGIELQLVAIRTCSACPICQTETDRVHSRYNRCLADLPWADVSVSIRLRVRRFFCVNKHCPRTVFCERLPGVTEPWARRTGRLARAQCAIGLALGGSAGARLSATLLMKAGIDLLLSLVRRMVQMIAPTPRVLGVDDWAKRKGQAYGTILVDLEQSRIVDLLPDRTAESLIQWLEGHPGIEIVSRDRSQTYADAISQAAPEAIQVADRWHLLKNLSDALFKILQEEYGIIKKQLAKTHEEEGAKCHQVELTTASGNDSSQELTPAEQRRKERMELAQRFHKQGWSQRDIARHLNVNRKTVSRYLRSFSARAWRHRKSRRLLDPFKPYILDR